MQLCHSAFRGIKLKKTGIYFESFKYLKDTERASIPFTASPSVLSKVLNKR